MAIAFTQRLAGRTISSSGSLVGFEQDDILWCCPLLFSYLQQKLFPSGQLNVYSKETAMGASAVLHKETQLNVRLKCLKMETAATFTAPYMEVYEMTIDNHEFVYVVCDARNRQYYGVFKTYKEAVKRFDAIKNQYAEIFANKEAYWTFGELDGICGEPIGKCIQYYTNYKDRGFEIVAELVIVAQILHEEES